jgi:hypothetical protein
MADIYGKKKSVRSPLTGKYFLTGDVMEGADTILERHLVSRLKNRTDHRILASGRGVGVLESLEAGEGSRLSEREAAVRAGRSFKADLIITGYIYRFKERRGKSYSIHTPASVAFDITLLDVSDGRVLWTGHVDETQQALSENLLQIGKFIQRKGAWVTAEEMASSGFDHILKTFP